MLERVPWLLQDAERAVRVEEQVAWAEERVVVVVAVARVLTAGVVARAVAAFGVGVEGVLERAARGRPSWEQVDEEKVRAEEIRRIRAR